LSKKLAVTATTGGKGASDLFYGVLRRGVGVSAKVLEHEPLPPIEP
jgi:hypothetical protein